MKDEIIAILRENKKNLFEKYPLKSMALFGSFVNGNASDKSDVDILVELNGTIGFDFLHLNYEIEDLLKRKVDLISKRGLKQTFINEIEPELIYV
ncbi:MAG TPA: nucleotidyltransferase family protein [Parafilimonas sp.]|nr:nucleotidyltransferase family protein [Parafilimonas sp.]